MPKLYRTSKHNPDYCEVGKHHIWFDQTKGGTFIARLNKWSVTIPTSLFIRMFTLKPSKMVETKDLKEGLVLEDSGDVCILLDGSEKGNPMSYRATFHVPAHVVKGLKAWYTKR